MSRLFFLVTVVDLVLATAAAGQVAARPDRIYVLDALAGTGGKGALFEVAPSGHRTILTDFGFTSRLPGAKHEPKGSFPIGLAVGASGRLLVVDRNAGGHGLLFAVDPSTGERSVLSDFGDKRQGPRANAPSDVAVAPDGRILVIDPLLPFDNGVNVCLRRAVGCGTLLGVDPNTGERSVVSDFSNLGQGQGLAMAMTGGVAAASSGAIYTTALFQVPGTSAVKPALVHVEPATGRRTIVSTACTIFGTALAVEDYGHVLESCGNLVRIDSTTGTGQFFAFAADVGNGNFGTHVTVVRGSTTPALQDGTILVVSTDLDPLSLFPIDPVTGASQRAVTSFLDPAQGPLGIYPIAVAFLPGSAPPPPPPPGPPPSGTIIALDRDAGGPGVLLGIDPATGKRTVLTSYTDASEGPTIAAYQSSVGPDGTVVTTGISLMTAPTAPNDGLLVKVDPATRRRTTLSDFRNSTQGPLGFTPFAIAFDSDGSILVTDRGFGGGSGTALWRVDPGDGHRSPVGDFSSSLQGPVVIDPVGVAVGPDGAYYVADASGGSDCHGTGDPCGRIVRVDRTGARRVVSDFGNAMEGPLGVDPETLVFEPDGRLLVLDLFAGSCPGGCAALFRVDLARNTRTLLSDYGDSGFGPLPTAFMSGVLVRSDGSILTGGCPGLNGAGGLCSVDRVTGQRALFNDFGDASLGYTGGDALSLSTYP